MKAEIPALVLTGYGLNCDHETAYALGLAGAAPKRVHINDLVSGEESLKSYRILVFTGGFGWADDHGAGVVQAVKMKSRLGDAVREFIAAGNLVIGICNGMQVLANMGLLPGFDGRTDRLTAMAANDRGNFRDDWVHLAVNTDSPCVFTRGIDRLDLPVRHGEGKFVTGPDTHRRLCESGQVVLRYAAPDYTPAGGVFPYNPNGSLDDIAGICDPTGRVFGLMPHPEAYNHPTNHPDWHRMRESVRRRVDPPPEGPTPGIRLFRNAVSAAGR